MSNACTQPGSGLLRECAAVGVALVALWGVEPTTRADQTVAHIGHKGSLLVFPKFEVRWDSTGNVIQDTFISLSNDYSASVEVQMFFVAETGAFVDNIITLTRNEPTYWSAATGLPKGVVPVSVLGLGLDPEGSGEVLVRGYLIAWATDNEGTEIDWDHLTGSALVVRYDTPLVWEYQPWAFWCDAGASTGEPCGTDAGYLHLDGAEYDAPPYGLMLNFYAAGATLQSGETTATTSNTDVTLLPMSLDFRQTGLFPTSTRARFYIYNENEVRFSGLTHCIRGWDETLFTGYGGTYNNWFRRDLLQTDRGRAWINTEADASCQEDPNDPAPVVAPLVGVAARLITAGGYQRAVGEVPIGYSAQTGSIRIDLPEPPDPVAPKTLWDRLLAATENPDIRRGPESSADNPAKEERAGETPRVTIGRDGSLLVFPNVELRWQESGSEWVLTQDTILEVANDYADLVQIQAYLVDEHWHRLGHIFSLTAEQPTTWSAAAGGFESVPAFTAVHPGSPPGDPDPESGGYRVLRGFVLLWAVDNAGREIRWNYLSGRATVVDHSAGRTWGYEAYAFEALDQGGAISHGEVTGTPFTLNLDGVEYGPCFFEQHLEFFAVGSYALSREDPVAPYTVINEDIDITQLAMDITLNWASGAPTVQTKAQYFLWNENEIQFSGTEYCVGGWDQRLANNIGGCFLISNLTTDRGRARIRPVASVVCGTSDDYPLLGVQNRLINVVDHGAVASGSTLVGAGTSTGTIRVDGDCNSNAIKDSDELLEGARDCNNNGVLDECENDCDCNGVDDAIETGVQLFWNQSALLPLTTPSGTVTHTITAPPTALGTVTVMIEGVGVPFGGVTLKLNDTVVGGGTWSGAPTGCESRIAYVSVSETVFNTLVAGGNATWTLIVTGNQVCPGATVRLTTWYPYELPNDCNGNGHPDTCDIAQAETYLLTARFQLATLPAGWTATGLWHLSTSCPGSIDPNAIPGWAYFGVDPNCNFSTGARVQGALTAPAVTIPAWATSAQLRYTYRYGGEAGDSALSGYDWAWVSASGTEIDDVSLAGDQLTWQLRNVNLSGYIGQTITLAWNFDSRDAVNNSELGWEVDDITLVVTAAPGNADCNGNGVPDECDVLGAETVHLEARVESATFPPSGWSATGLWHGEEGCARSNACDPSKWAYFGRTGYCDFATGNQAAGALIAPTVTLPASAVSATLTYCSAYGGEGGVSNQSGWDWAWVAVGPDQVDDVSQDGNQPVWEERTVDLSAYIGQSVTLSWNFDSRDEINNSGLGWQVDHVRLTTRAAGSSADCNHDGVPDECQSGLVPAISEHPVDQNVSAGQTAAFTVTASGAPTLYYQWRRNETNLADGERINGVTTPTLTISSAQVEDEGEYDVRVWNTCGQIYSTAATLTVTPVAICRGDTNCDGTISYGDINPFVLALNNLSAWQAQFPGCPWQNCDVNDDGVISYADINPFVLALGSPGPCP